MLQFKNVVVSFDCFFQLCLTEICPLGNLLFPHTENQRENLHFCTQACNTHTHTHTQVQIKIQNQTYTHTCRGKSECFFAHVNQQTTISICLVFIFLSYYFQSRQQRRRRAKALQSVDSRTLHTHSSEDFIAHSPPSHSPSLPVLMALTPVQR